MVYFISDSHIGSLLNADSAAHQQRICAFLESIRHDATALFLMGDIFDFWFEYKHTIPKGYDRLLGKLAELADSGIEVHFFVGNHDLWTFGYLEQSLGIRVHHKEEIMTICGKKCFLAHGDTLDTENKQFMFLLRVFKSPFNQWLFRNVMPANIGMRLALSWSKKSRLKRKNKVTEYLGENNEVLVRWAKEHEKIDHCDYYIFGHRHIELDLLLSSKARVIILGECINLFTYGMMDDDGNFTLTNF